MADRDIPAAAEHLANANDDRLQLLALRDPDMIRDVARAAGSGVTDVQIKQMVSRFLAWRLPENFRPDAGISFEPDYNVGTPHPMKHQPTGTNLFDATQAEAMVRHLVEGL